MCGYLIVLLVLGTISEARISHDPRITITETSPESKGNVVKGIIAKDVTMTCFVENKPENKDVRWQMVKERGGGLSPQVIPISQDMGSDDVNKWVIEKPTDFQWRLRVKAIQEADEGIYSCFVQLTIDTKVIANKTVRATDPPLIINAQMSTDTRAKQGDSIELMCNASGRPSPTIRWRRQGNEILPAGGVELFANKLVIDDVQPRHKGSYICEALNEMGFASRTIFFSVTYAPVCKAEQSEVSQQVGYRRSLICYVDADPAPTWERMTWMRNRMPLELNDRVYTRILKGAFGLVTYELVFSKVRKEDFGTYECYAGNTVSNVRCHDQITLSESDEPQRDKGYISGTTVAYQNIVLLIFMFLSSFLLMLS